MILITTAGKVGGDAARLLAAQDEPVRVLVRNPENRLRSRCLRCPGRTRLGVLKRRIGLGEQGEVGV